jgi:hypothetical protein
VTIDSQSPALRQLHINQFAWPFAFVRILGLIVVIYWIQGSGVALANAYEGNFYQLPFMLVLGFPAWVFWRNMDVISAVIDPLTRIAYRVLGTICLIAGLISGLALVLSDDGDTNPSLMFGIFIQFLFWGIMTLLAARSLSRLRHTKIDKIGISLEELVRSLRQATAKQTPQSTTASTVGYQRALSLIAVSIVLFFIYSVNYAYVGSAMEQATAFLPIPPEARFLKLAADVSFYGTCYFLLRARVKLQPTAESVLSVDRREPVLFLRSFVDDERIRFLRAERALFDFSLEARLATHFFRTGPFIAVDSPNHTAAIGAARASLTDAEWQGTVLEWMRAARLIVLLAGVSHWICWEMRRIVELGYSRKLVILMPELSVWKQFRFSFTRGFSSPAIVARKRLEAIREIFSGSPWETGLNEPCVPQQIRSLTFGLDGQVTAVCAKSRGRDCYQMAALISEYLISRELGVGTDENHVGQIGDARVPPPLPHDTLSPVSLAHL